MMESGQGRSIVVEEDDRGDMFYCRGHVDSRLFVRAVIRYLGDYEPVGDVIATIRGCGGRSAVLGRVRHVWRLPGQGWAVLGSAVGFTLGIFGGDIAAKLAGVVLGGAVVEAVVGSWVKDMAGRLKELPVEDDGGDGEGGRS
jgi:hypothetical protein